MVSNMKSQLRGLAWKSALLGAALYGFPRILSERSAEKLIIGEKIITGFWAVIVLRHLSMLFFRSKEDKSWDWSKEVVVVTGGSSGIGELVVKYLAEKGVKVAVMDVNPPKSTHGENVTFHQTDVTSSTALKTAADSIRVTQGDPTVLINNAGIGFARTILSESEEQIRKTLDVNLLAHFLTAKEFLPKMVESNHGHVLATASMASFVTCAQNVSYSAAKAGLLAFHEGLRQELDYRYNARNVRTSIVHPYWTRTPMNEAFIGRKEFPKDYLKPETVASAIVAQILSGQSGQVFLPGKLRLLSGIRGFPTWLQEKIRGQGSKVICD